MRRTSILPRRREVLPNSHQPCLDALHDLRSQVHGAPRMWDVQAGCHLHHRSMFGEHLHEFVILCTGSCHLVTAIQPITRADVSGYHLL
ncbi:hypothetical protein SORBI_3003G174301 [Sorghum bicolor]|uniref:Uncharacterized protein n=1 Tax=Sorghum bicolor TaxID=4558 RepID=A0A1W0VXR4_SORBI|nr:hypothetical protein SORBI_3003G174301 [Sorghum bicolor]